MPTVVMTGDRVEYNIVKIDGSTVHLLRDLADEAGAEGHGLVRRTMEDWYSGANRFRMDGEILWGVFADGTCVGIGGLNQDPYLNRDPYIDDLDVGRVRHLYVSLAHRRKGIARSLVRRSMERAAGRFKTLRLSTNNLEASNFYERMGFVEATGHKQTHVLKEKTC